MICAIRKPVLSGVRLRGDHVIDLFVCPYVCPSVCVSARCPKKFSWISIKLGTHALLDCQGWYFIELQ